jgi:hypothetical protein
LDTRYQHIWIGKDHKNGKFALGNTILVQTSQHEYIFIGTEMYRFKTKEPILQFCSPLGNSDVSYPFAKTHHFTYLLIEYLAIPNYLLKKLQTRKMEPKWTKDVSDPYGIYYGQTTKQEQKRLAFDYKFRKKMLVKRIF